MSKPKVYIGFCKHEHPVVAVVDKYASDEDLSDMVRRGYRIELVDGPFTMRGICTKCEEAKS